MASRKLTDLRKDLQDLAIKHLEECSNQGIDLLIYCTYRSGEEQDMLYAQGRTTPGKIVTNARAGQSKHNNTSNGHPSALAYDCVPCIGGKPQWSDIKLYARVGQIGESVGLKWAGRWTGKLKETAHFEI